MKNIPQKINKTLTMCHRILFLFLAVASFLACAEVPAKAAVGALSVCNAGKNLYFDCKVDDTSYRLCRGLSERFVFWQLNGGKEEKILSGVLGKDFTFDGYNRFKVTHNALLFSAGELSYEVFEYIDEESKPALMEYGLVVSKNSKNKESLYCEAGALSRLSEFR